MNKPLIILLPLAFLFTSCDTPEEIAEKRREKREDVEKYFKGVEYVRVVTDQGDVWYLEHEGYDNYVIKTSGEKISDLEEFIKPPKVLTKTTSLKDHDFGLTSGLILIEK